MYDLCGKSFFLYCVLSNFRGRLPFPYFQNGSGNSGSGKKELGILISVCVGRELYGYAEFLEGTNEEKEKLFSIFDNNGKTEAELHAYAAVLAIGVRFSMDNGNFFDIFENRYHYIEK